MRNRVLLIDNYDSFTFNLRQILVENNCDYTICMNDKFAIGEVEQFNKILISPGPGLPSEAGIISQVIQMYKASKSILGVCLGHQAIAEVFGGELYNFSTVCHGLSVKAKIIDDKDYLFNALPSEIEVGLYHSWAVKEENFPSELKITAISNDGIIMALAHKQYDIKGVQFHPESIMTKFGKQILSNWLNHQLEIF